MGDELIAEFREMPQAKSDYVLKELVIGQHDTVEMQYAHTILNLRIAYNALRKAKIHLEKVDYEIAELKAKDDKMSEFEWREKDIDRDETECAVIGKMREFNCLYKIWKSFPKKYTRADVNANQPEYWKRRAIRQKNQDLIATGRVNQGNQDLLRQLDMGITPLLDHSQEVEHKFIEGSKTDVKIMIATPVEKHIRDKEMKDFKLSCLEGLLIPPNSQVKTYICHGRKVADAYNDIIREFLKDGADYLLTLEDDTFPPSDALVKLMEHIADGKKVVGAWYPMRDGTGDGVPIIEKNGKREQLDSDGDTHEVYALPMGCTLYSKEVFYHIEQPYFKTGILSQDSFFSQKLRDVGYTLYCDTSIRCKHIDRETSRVYE